MVSKEQFLEIRRCHQKGMTANEIAKKVGVSAPSVRKWWNVEEKTLRHNTKDVDCIYKHRKRKQQMKNPLK